MLSALATLAAGRQAPRHRAAEAIKHCQAGVLLGNSA
jgi:hypothetical protein